MAGTASSSETTQAAPSQNAEPPRNAKETTTERTVKKATMKNTLLGLQHVLVSNVWLDPVFVAGAIGLPLALSSNMVNAIFIVSGLVTLIQATKLVRLPIVQGPVSYTHLTLPTT